MVSEQSFRWSIIYPFIYLVINKGTDSGYFVKEYSTYKFKYTDHYIISMVNFSIDNIYVECGGVIGIPMGTNCGPLLEIYFSGHLFYISLYRWCLVIIKLLSNISTLYIIYSWI